MSDHNIIIIPKRVGGLTSGYALWWGSTYIIGTAVANAIKARFYQEDVPLLEDVSLLLLFLSEHYPLTLLTAIPYAHQQSLLVWCTKLTAV